MAIGSQAKNWSQFDDSKMIESVPITPIAKKASRLQIWYGYLELFATPKVLGS
jgi:hypothetical protein